MLMRRRRSGCGERVVICKDKRRLVGDCMACLLKVPIGNDYRLIFACLK